MLIKENVSEQDIIDTQLEIYNLVGITKKKLFNARFLWIFVLSLGIALIIIGGLLFKLKNSGYTYLIVGFIYFFYALYVNIFLKKIYKSQMIKNLKKYYATARQKYNINETYEVTTEIKDGYIEASSLGTTTKYSLKDYVSKFENDKFYIFEFTNGRYFFFKKDNFQNKEKYDELVNAIEEGIKN